MKKGFKRVNTVNFGNNFVLDAICYVDLEEDWVYVLDDNSLQAPKVTLEVDGVRYEDVCRVRGIMATYSNRTLLATREDALNEPRTFKVVGDTGISVDINGRFFKKKADNKWHIAGFNNMSNKYGAISVKKKGKQAHEYIHRLYAEAFCPNPKNHNVVRAMDDDYFNLSVDNIKWVDYREKLSGRWSDGYEYKECHSCGGFYNIRDDRVLCAKCHQSLEQSLSRAERQNIIVSKIRSELSSVEYESLDETERIIYDRRWLGISYSEIGNELYMSDSSVVRRYKKMIGDLV